MMAKNSGDPPKPPSEASTPAELDVPISLIQTARTELGKLLPPSPLLLNPWLSDEFGCEIYLKLENMQPIGSFKIRGATFKIMTLTPEQRKLGVIAASAGNHAQGVAWGAQKLGSHATILMPKSASLMKIQNTRALGATVELAGDNYIAAYEEAKARVASSGAVYVHAFEDPAVIAGQGTVALEILEQLPDPDFVVGSIGGGGLMAGVGIAFKTLRPQTQIVGCQASGAPSMVRSIQAGKIIPFENSATFADGISVSRASEPMRKLLASRMDELVDRPDEEIASAVLLLMEKAKIVAEGSGALPLAALEAMRQRIRGKKVVLIVSGGNIDVNLLARIIDRGLIRSGRRIRVNVMIPDRPGSLARLTDLIARQGANIIQAIHDRSEPSTTLDRTDVALTLETRGDTHSQEVIAALREQTLRVEVVH
jgi:threonine dehydratase